MVDSARELEGRVLCAFIRGIDDRGDDPALGALTVVEVCELLRNPGVRPSEARVRGAIARLEERRLVVRTGRAACATDSGMRRRTTWRLRTAVDADDAGEWGGAL